MEMPRFSIIIPIYNAEKYLEKCMESVENQTYQDYEVLLINDGSKDSSLEMIRKKCGENPKFRYIDKENEGQLLTTHRGYVEAKGEYIVSLDSDDYFDLDYLEQIDNILKKHPVDILILAIKRVSEKGEYINELSHKEVGKTLGKTEFFSYLIGNNQYNSMCGKVVKNSCYCKSYSFEADKKVVHGEDGIHTLRILQYGAVSTIYVSEYSGYNYRMNQTSITHTLRVAEYKDRIYLVRAFKNYASDLKITTGIPEMYIQFLGGICDYILLLLNSKEKVEEKKRIVEFVNHELVFQEACKYADSLTTDRKLQVQLMRHWTILSLYLHVLQPVKVIRRKMKGIL